jgi:hypothetical protein
MFSLFKKTKTKASELELLVRSKTEEEVKALVLGQMLVLRNALAGHGQYETVPVRTGDLKVREVNVADLMAAVEAALLQVQRRTVYDRALAAATTDAAKLAAGTVQPVQGGLTEQLQTNEPSAEDKEVLHWVSQGLNKLGYSITEARRVAQQHVRKGMSVEQGIQACLRGRGRLD